MPAPATANEFLTLVRQSGLVEEERLSDGLARAGPLPEKADDLAKLLVRDGLLTQFQSKQLLLGRWKRFTIGEKYRLLELLGVGGMGAVYLCEHVHLHRLVAVKVLTPDRLHDPSAVVHFKREARTSAALDHPNIVHTYDFDSFDRMHVLVLEFVDGSSLQEIVSKHGPLSVERSVNYVWQAALGLQHAHELGLVHRDIKPGNLLLDRSGAVKILDMGLARFADADHDPQNSDEGFVYGTADYMAPEQAFLQAIDGRADLYSLGGTWYFLLTRRTPFPGGSVTQKLASHRAKEPTPIEELRPDLPAELAAVWRKLMAKKPEDRYQTPAELAEALAPFLSEVEPPPAHEMPSLSPAALSVGRTGDAGPRSPSPASSKLRALAAVHSGSDEFRAATTGSGERRAVADTVALPTTPARGWRPRQSVRRVRLVTAVAVTGAAVLLVVVGVELGWALRPAPADSAPTPGAERTAADPETGDDSRPLAARDPIPLEAARQLPAGEVCTVVFRVASVGGQAQLYLNSRADYQDGDNFAVLIPAHRIAHFPPGDHVRVGLAYAGKTVRATGTIRTAGLSGDRREILLVVTHPENLVVIERPGR